MDLNTRTIFLLLLGACGVILILMANLVEFGSTNQVFLVAANFHNNSVSYLTSLNLNLSFPAKKNHQLQSLIEKKRFKSNLDNLIRNRKLNVADVKLRYQNKHNKSYLLNEISSYMINNTKEREVTEHLKGIEVVTEQLNSVNAIRDESKQIEATTANSFGSDSSNLENIKPLKARQEGESNTLSVHYKENDLMQGDKRPVLNHDHSKLSHINTVLDKSETVFDNRQPYRDVSTYITQSTPTDTVSDTVQTVNDNSEREITQVIPASVREVIIDPDNLDTDTKNYIDNQADTLLISKDRLANDQTPFTWDFTGHVRNSKLHEQNGYTQRETSKSDLHAFQNKTGTVEADDTTGLLKEEGFITDQSCIKHRTGVEDILCMKRPEFLPDFRNPCWYQQGSLRCLPYFHIIGVCKTGTTDLFERLSHHPQILKNRGILGKETWYWTWKRYGQSNFYRAYTTHKTFDEFIDEFDAGTIERYTKRLPNGTLYHPVVTGHGDPMDFWDQASWRLIPQNDPSADIPEVTTPSLIKHVNPNIKLILILRDPVERLFSNYLHGQFGMTAEQFHQDVLTSQSILASCTRYRSIKSCLYDENIIRNLRVPISGSFYSVHLKEWLKVFPRKQIFITRTEDFAKSVADTLLRIFRFLRLDPIPIRDLYRIANMPHFYNTKAKETSGEVRNETRTILRSMFEPYNNELASILNDQKFNFNNI